MLASPQLLSSTFASGNSCTDVCNLVNAFSMLFELQQVRFLHRHNSSEKVMATRAKADDQ